MDRKTLIRALFEKVLGKAYTPKNIQSLEGGCINEVYKLSCSNASFVLKLNSLSKYPAMFELEQQGLQLLSHSRTLRVPEVLEEGVFNDHQFLILEYVETEQKTKLFWIRFAEDLAALHKMKGTSFGLETDNYIGSLPQLNTRNENWISFFETNRLRPLVNRAIEQNLIKNPLADRIEKLYPKLSELLAPGPPSLLHGDLWSSNILVSRDQKACVLDPAVYYGHREIEIAYTGLFGGFDPLFYKVYQEIYPMVPGYSERFKIYNLYPLLVHVLLFGPAYLKPIDDTLDQFM